MRRQRRGDLRRVLQLRALRGLGSGGKDPRVGLVEEIAELAWGQHPRLQQQMCGSSHGILGLGQANLIGRAIGGLQIGAGVAE